MLCFFVLPWKKKKNTQTQSVSYLEKNPVFWILGNPVTIGFKLAR